MFDKLATIERDSVERLATGDVEPSHSTVVLMNFESPPVPDGHDGMLDHEGAVSNTAAAVQ